MVDSVQRKQNGTVIYIGPFDLPDRNAAAHRVLNIGKILREIGYDVIFIGTQAENLCDGQPYEVEGFKCYDIGYKGTQDKIIKLSELKEFKYIYPALDDVKAVITYNYPALGFWRLLSFCRRKKIKIFADCTEWYDPSGENKLFRSIKQLDTALRMKVLNKKVDGVIAISRFLYDYYKDSVKTVCVPPMVDISESKWERENDSGSDILSFVYAGSPGKDKDKINKVIEAFSVFTKRKFRFDVIGITKQKYLEYYPNHLELIEKMSDKVIFHGRISHTDVLDITKKADFTIFYRDITRVTTAGFPTKFSESISCKTPVITNLSSNISDFLTDGVNGFVLDCDNIQKSFQRIFEHSDAELKNLKNNVIKNTFDYHNYIEQIKEFLIK